jgi:hypothetical protein
MLEEPDVTVDTSSTQVHTYVRHVPSWTSAQEEFGFFPETWIFRGQRDAAWGLRCNLDRKRGSTDPVHVEGTVKNEFVRRAHLFLPNAREPESTLEWLALIQHHGGPTRLIDFTRSPLIAAFFALEEDAEAGTCAVWRIDELACHSRAVKRLRAVAHDYSWLRSHHDIEGAVESRLGVQPPDRFVAPVRPSRYNSRLALQQGIFVCLGDPGSDLFGNLNIEVEDEEPLRVVKIEFPRNGRGQALWNLRRLGISRETLFPGLDGLAQSLAHLFIPRNLHADALLAAMERPSGWPGPLT